MYLPIASVEHQVSELYQVVEDAGGWHLQS
jgi:hypothetical protein